MLINLMSIGRINKINLEFLSISNGLLQTIQWIFIFGLGFNDSKINVFITQQIIYRVTLAAFVTWQFSAIGKKILKSMLAGNMKFCPTRLFQLRCN